MRHQIQIEKNVQNGKSKKVCIDGVWYPSLSQIPAFSYLSLDSYRRKHGLTTEEAIDALLVRKEQREQRHKIWMEEEQKRRERWKVLYEGEVFPSLAQCIRVINRRKNASITYAAVYTYQKRHRTDAQTAINACLQKTLPVT